jgi:hypothetical protein
VSSGSVDRASLVSDLVFVHPLEGVVCLSSVTTIVSGTGNQNLRSDIDIRPSCFSGDFDSVRESRSGSMGPARAAVLGDMLVPNVGEVIDSINIVPNPLFGKFNSGQWLFHVSELWLIRCLSASLRRVYLPKILLLLSRDRYSQKGSNSVLHLK